MMNFTFPPALVLVMHPRRKYTEVIANFSQCYGVFTLERIQAWADIVSLAKRRGLRAVEGTCRIYMRDVLKEDVEKLVSELVAIMAPWVRGDLAIAHLDPELNMTKSVALPERASG